MGNGWHCNGSHGDCDPEGGCSCDCGYCRKEHGDLPWHTALCQDCYEPTTECSCRGSPQDQSLAFMASVREATDSELQTLLIWQSAEAWRRVAIEREIARRALGRHE